jgi:hypothetical protein
MELVRWTFKSSLTIKDGFEFLQFSILGRVTTNKVQIHHNQHLQAQQPIIQAVTHHYYHHNLVIPPIQLLIPTYITKENFSLHMDLFSQFLSSLTDQHPDYILVASELLELLYYISTVVTNFFPSFEESDKTKLIKEEEEGRIKPSTSRTVID